jgi:hypothetical protein
MKISKRRLDDIYHTLYSDCFPQHSYKFYKKLNQKKKCFFFHLAMNQMITFNTSLDSEKKNLTRPSLKNYMCPFKKKS